MNPIETIEPYRTRVNPEILEKWGGVIRVWSEPASLIDGAKVVGKITEQTEVTAIAEQKDIHGSIPERIKIRYGNRQEGWVLFETILPV